MRGRTISDLLMEFEPRQRPSGRTDERVVPFERRAAPATPTPELDVKARLEEAYQRGRTDGRAAAILECDEKLKEYAAGALKQSAEDRARWVDEQSGVIADQFGAAWKQLETGVTDTLARLLEPFLLSAIQRQAVEEFVKHLNAVVDDANNPVLRISGPSDLLRAIKSKCEGRSRVLELVPQERCEVRLTSDQAILETQMRIWIERLKQMTS